MASMSGGAGVRRDPMSLSRKATDDASLDAHALHAAIDETHALALQDGREMDEAEDGETAVGLDLLNTTRESGDSTKLSIPTPTPEENAESLPAPPSLQTVTTSRVYYLIDDEETPYMTEVHVAPNQLTLADVKRVLNRSNFKFYVKSVDPDTNLEVKEEIRDDRRRLQPSNNGRFVLYLLTTENGSAAAGQEENGGARGGRRHFQSPGAFGDPLDATLAVDDEEFGLERDGHYVHNSMLSTDSESAFGVGAAARRRGHGAPRTHHHQHSQQTPFAVRPGTSSALSESEARFSDDDDRGSTTTDMTSVSRQHENYYRRRQQQHQRRAYRQQQQQQQQQAHGGRGLPSRASSFSSITESSLSLDVITVVLNMDAVNFLGISIVGQSSADGDNGIYIANIMKGGAVALDGRLEQGDMILQVNSIPFTGFTNDQAVEVLRDAVARKGPIKLVVAKSFEGGPRSTFTVPRYRDEPVRPIDTNAWVAHTNAMRGAMPSILEGSEGAPTPVPPHNGHGGHHHHHHHHHRPPSSATGTSTGSAPTVVSGGGGGGGGGGGNTNGNNHNASSSGQNLVLLPQRLELHTDPRRICQAAATPGSGLAFKDRTWLKLTIPMSFLGKDLVDWLQANVDGLRERKDAKRYAARLLEQRFIAHVVSKRDFTEQCYYVLGEHCQDIVHWRTSIMAAAAVMSNGCWSTSSNGGGSSLPPPPPPHLAAAAAAAVAANSQQQMVIGPPSLVRLPGESDDTKMYYLHI